MVRCLAGDLHRTGIVVVSCVLLLKDLTISLNVYNDKLKDLSSARGRLTTAASAECLMVLDQRLHLLDRLWTEVHDQVLQRCAWVQGRLDRWSDFDEQCRRLTDDIAKCESAIEDSRDTTIEDLIVALQTVSWCLVLLLVLVFNDNHNHNDT